MGARLEDEGMEGSRKPLRSWGKHHAHASLSSATATAPIPRGFFSLGAAAPAPPAEPACDAANFFFDAPTADLETVVEGASSSPSDPRSSCPHPLPPLALLKPPRPAPELEITLPSSNSCSVNLVE